MRETGTYKESMHVKQQLISYSLMTYKREHCQSRRGGNKVSIFTLVLCFLPTFFISFFISGIAIACYNPDSLWGEHLLGTFYTNTTAEQNVSVLKNMEVDDVSAPVTTVEASCFYYYSMLDSKAKNAYDEIYHGIVNRKNKIDYQEFIDRDTFNLVTTCLLADHPELIWFEGHGQLDLGKNVFYPSYILDEDEIVENKSMIFDHVYNLKQIMDFSENVENYELGKKEKAHIIVEYIANITSYNSEAEHNQNLMSVFNGGETVCAGYSKAVVYLAREFGIPAMYSFGDAYGNVDGNNSEIIGKHAWVVFVLDGTTSYCDPTWYDSDYEYDESMFDAGVDFHDTHKEQLVPA